MTKKEEQTDETKIALIAKDIEYITKKVDSIDKKLEGDYVTREEFDPIKKIVYGLVSLILIAVIGAILALVIKQ